MSSTLANSSQGKFDPGTECIAKYNFAGTSKKDLPLKKGDIVQILRMTKDPNWYEAKKLSDNSTGFIPISYVQERRGLNLHAMPWFFGKIKREVAEDLLKPRDVGLFLVRESTNYPGDYTLCVVSPEGGKIEHYRVISRKNKLTVDEEEFFDNLVDLVKHYEKDADGLCTRLKIPKTKPKDLNISSQVFVQSFEKEGWLVNSKDISCQDQIGSGEFGVVSKGEYQGRLVAIKKLKDDSKAAQTFLAEASVMTTLHHKNLVDLIGIYFENNALNMVTEFCKNGALVDYLRSRGRAVITKDKQIGFACDICNGMQYLEEKKIVHRDLAARNVLLAEDLTAKVADFGLARDVALEMEKGKFPVKWTAPEAIQDNAFSTKSDIWSFGVLLWEIFSYGRNPYPRVPLNEVLQKVNKGYRMEIPEGCSQNIYQLMKDCWELKPERRPTFRTLARELADPDRETKV